MAIAFGVAGTRCLVGTASSSWAVPYPATVAANDLLVLHIITNGGAVTAPAGWTEVFNEATLTNPRGGLFIKVADGTETGDLSVTVGNSTGNAMIFSYTGVDTTTPQDAAATSVENSASTTDSTMPAITTVTADTMLVYANSANSGSTTMTGPAGSTERVDHGVTGGTGTKAGALYDEAVAATGSTGTRAITLSASRANWGVMMALRPAAGGGPSPQTMSPTGIASTEAFGTPFMGGPTAVYTTFDDGTSEGWTSSTAGAGTTAITSAAAHDGPFGASADVPAATGDKAGFVRTISGQQVTVRGWWKVTTEGASSGSNVPFTRVFEGTQRLAGIYRQNAQAGANVWLRVAKAIGGTNYYFIPTGYTLPLDTWVYVSFTWGLDGIPHLFIDGVEYLNASDAPADFYAATQIDTVYLGTHESGNQGAWAMDSVDLITGPLPAASEIHNEPILTGEAFGAPTITISAPPVSPTGIASAEAFGLPAASTTLIASPAAIAPSEAVGAPSISTALTVSPSGVATAGALGTPSLTATLTASPTGIATAEALGAPSLSATLTVSPGGIAGAEAVGVPTVSPSITASPAGIATGEALGAPSLSIPIGTSPAGIASGEIFGTPTIGGNLNTFPPGIASAQAFGSPTISNPLPVNPTGIATAEAFGAPSLALGSQITPPGIASAEAIGSPAVSALLAVLPAGVDSSEGFGSPAIYADLLVTQAGGIATAAAFGSPTISAGGPGQTLSPTGIPSAGALGAPFLTWDRTVTPASIVSLEAFGIPRLSTVVVTHPDTIVPSYGMGVPTLQPKLTTAPVGIPGQEAFGVPALEHIVLEVVPTGVPTLESFGAPKLTGGSQATPYEMSGSLPKSTTSGSLLLPGTTFQTPNRWEGILD